MNHLEVRTRKATETPEPNYWLTEILVDGQLLEDFEESWLAIDLLELQRSVHEDGEFFIVTCFCGIPGCAGIKKGIRVYRDSKNVHWVVRLPQQEAARTFVFEQNDYETAVERGVRQVRQILAKHPGLDVCPSQNKLLDDLL